MNFLSKKKLHIILLDNPYPPNYGGAIDMWNKIIALDALGVQLQLHCFTYGNRNSLTKLEQYAEHLYLYPRATQKSNLISRTPYIVKSRKHPELLENLIQDQTPILFEGLHTCAFLNHEYLDKRLKIVRCHNVEHDYYMGLSRSINTRVFKKQFFKMESKKLKRYEKQLSYADHILGITKSDTEHFEQYAPSLHVPAFHNAPQSIKEINKDNPYILYQGNLEVEENQNAVLKLIENVFQSTPLKVIIAGQNPGGKIKEAIAQHQNITLIDSPDEDKMNTLIQGATIHLLYSEQNTGVKLKLIHALFTGGHIIINDNMVFDPLCYDQLEVVNNWTDIIQKTEVLKAHKAPKDRTALKALFDNKENAKKIIELL